MISCVCGYRGAGIGDGSTMVCPICRTPVAATPAAPAPPAPAGGLRMPPPPGALPPAPARPASAPLAVAAPRSASGGMLRIPCPNGHVLKTKRSMLGQQVVCPSCNEFFTLEETASLEYKQEAARRRAHEDEERAQKWLWRAIYSAIFIVLSFIVMAVIGSNPQWFQK
jgi:uncharacterized Zn finger protein (UPF0148 family)